MVKVEVSLPFLEGTRWSGAAEVLHVTDDHQHNDHIYIRLRVGKRFLWLPRAELRDVIQALSEADDEASRRYTQLIRRMNPKE